MGYAKTFFSPLTGGWPLFATIVWGLSHSGIYLLPVLCYHRDFLLFMEMFKRPGRGLFCIWKRLASVFVPITGFCPDVYWHLLCALVGGVASLFISTFPLLPLLGCVLCIQWALKPLFIYLSIYPFVLKKGWWLQPPVMQPKMGSWLIVYEVLVYAMTYILLKFAESWFWAGPELLVCMWL